uniref:thiolase family protein n=1 Tax=Thaumasiovibrio occultus TaxID=1891184 RepID=UPI000B35FC60|nr:thiolase family protein [Thaumasiovibrio occultus]
MSSVFHQPIWVTAATRSPLGQYMGALQSVSAVSLATPCVEHLHDWSDLQPDTLYLGQVLQAGAGQAPARQVALAAGIDEDVPVTTLNKVCGSGMMAVMVGCDQIRLGRHDIVVAGGMESMSMSPYLQHRTPPRMGHATLYDHLFYDGLENADDHRLMGHFGELLAQEMGYERAQLDEWALMSVTRAQYAVEHGVFDAEITPLPHLASDEIPLKLKPERISQLKPAFKPQGLITAANASAMADGAAALTIMSKAQGQRLDLVPLAHIIGYSEYAHAPKWFTTAPIYAIEKLLLQVGWRASEVDLWEINEAFAVVSLHAAMSLGINPEKVNIHGGACALGHPLGATGARIIVTLIYALRAKGLHRGIAALCIGGGEATAIAIEIPE